MLSRLAFDVELLTPAFVGGPTPRRLDEYMPLRPSTVRGMLRSWFRVGAAALLWPRDSSPHEQSRAIEALRQAESALFGRTERASTVVVLPPEGGEPVDISPPDPAQYPGVRYLGYGLFDDRNLVPQALRTPPNLRLTLGPRREVAGVRELLGATVWLWLALGGLGARSRRGFGSMQLAGGDDDLGWPPELRGGVGTHTELAQQLVRGLAWSTGVFREHLPALTQHPLKAGEGPHPALRTLHGIGTVAVLPVDAASGHEALDRAGRLFRDFRSTLRRRDLGMPPLPDYFTVKASIQSRRPPSNVDRAALPADARLPDHTVAAHRSLTAALAGATLRDDRPALLAIHVGPVQSFIEAARRTHDLSIGSYTVGFLAFAAARMLARELGPDVLIHPDVSNRGLADQLIFEDPPSVKDRPKLLRAALVNRILAVVPDRRGDELARQAAKSVADTWRAMGKATRKYLERHMAIDERDFDGQIDPHLDLDLVVQRWPGTNAEIRKLLEDAGLPRELWLEEAVDHPGAACGALIDLTERTLAAHRKTLTPVARGGDPRPKCTICGLREQVGPRVEPWKQQVESRRFFEKLSEDLQRDGRLRGSLQIVRGEGCARCA